MDEVYFRHVRRDIDPLLPASAHRILDVGAGTGATSAWLKSRYPGCTTIALEGNAAIRDELARNVDEAVILDLNGQIPDVGVPDLVLCLDVLEHLLQPVEVLKRVTSTMPDGGTVIVSVPNIAHASVSLPLLLRARFEYQDAGILDRTHVRFFDRVSVVALMNHAGLVVRRGVRLGFDGPRARLIDAVTGHALRDHLTKQYVVAGTRNLETPAQQGPVEWLTA
jgi:trans-aconitate methyltransferase